VPEALMERKEFIFVMRRPDGQEYDMAVSALRESDARRRLKNLLFTTVSSDKIVSLKESQTDDMIVPD
jgi:hypothetical protein